MNQVVSYQQQTRTTVFPEQSDRRRRAGIHRTHRYGGREGRPLTEEDNKVALLLRSCLFVTVAAYVLGAAVLAEDQNLAPYVPQWYSLDQHQTPQWLQDAKVGLFVYPLHPTEEQFNAYKAEHGHLGKYRAQDGWDVTPWDSDEVAQLARDAGARYVVFGVDPFSFFVTWPSKYADIEGSPFTHLNGPGADRDYVAEIAAAVRQRGTGNSGRGFSPIGKPEKASSPGLPVSGGGCAGLATATPACRSAGEDACRRP